MKICLLALALLPTAATRPAPVPEASGAQTERLALKRDPKQAERLPGVAAPRPIEVAARVAAPDPKPVSAPIGSEAPTRSRSSARTWAIQVGAFSEEATARRLHRTLQDKDYPVAVVESTESSRGWRVRVQPIRGEDEARAVASRLKREERLPTWESAIIRSFGTPATMAD